MSTEKIGYIRVTREEVKEYAALHKLYLDCLDRFPFDRVGYEGSLNDYLSHKYGKEKGSVRADLSGAKLHGAELHKSTFWRADINGAEVGGVDFTQAILAGVIIRSPVSMALNGELVPAAVPNFVDREIKALLTNVANAAESHRQSPQDRLVSMVASPNASRNWADRVQQPQQPPSNGFSVSQ